MTSYEILGKNFKFLLFGLAQKALNLNRNIFIVLTWAQGAYFTLIKQNEVEIAGKPKRNVAIPG